MKKRVLVLIAALFLFPHIVQAGTMHPYFEDANMYLCVVDSYNKQFGTTISYDTKLTEEQLNAIETLSCNGVNKTEANKIVNTKGIEKLVLLREVYLQNNKIETVDLSQNDKIKTVRLESNQLKRIHFGDIDSVSYLSLSNNNLTNLALTKFKNLMYLDVNGNDLTSLDVQNNVNLQVLWASQNLLKTIDIGANRTLKSLVLDSHVKVHLTKLEPSLQIRGGFITKISPNSTVATLKTKILSNNANYLHTFIDKGTEMNEKAIIKTGSEYTVSYQENNVKQYSEKYTLVVNGDVTGTGNTSIADVARLYQYYKKKVAMEPAFILAGDVTQDGEIEMNDVTKLYQYLKGRINSLE